MSTRRLTQFGALGLSGAVLWLGGSLAMAGTFGVPTNLAADGRVCVAAGNPDASCTATSVNPPGWIVLTGPGAANNVGDTVHQIRLFIEVADRGTVGTADETLNIRVFDAGADTARDGTGATASSTTYALLNPNGGAVAGGTVTITNDSATTGDRLARLSSTGAFTAANAGTVFSGLAAGLYELRVTVTAGDEVNAFGVDIRDQAGTHYNVYTVGSTNTPDTALVAGTVTEGAATPAAATQPMIFFPYVNRGCNITTSSYDMDADIAAGSGASAAINDTFGVTTALAASSNQLHVENTITVEPTTTINLDATNYGMFTVTNNTGSQDNRGIEWRVADFTGWNTNPLARPRDPAAPIRMYLPNGYAPVAGNPNAGTPLEPRLAVSARVESGTNPPQVGATTTYSVTSSVDNLSGGTISNVVVTVPLVTGMVFVSSSATIDGAASTCTETTGAGYRRCTFATLASGSVASYHLTLTDTPTATGLRYITGATATRSAQLTGLTYAAGTGLATGTSAAHGFQTGDYVTIYGAEQSAYNGLFQITRTGADTFTYTPAGTPTATPATGATILAIVPGCAAAADGPVCATYTPSFSSATYTRSETLGPICPLTVYVTPTNIDLRMTKTAGAGSVTAGQDVTYTLTVANPATSGTATNVILTDIVPAGTTLRSLTKPVAWTCTSPPVGTRGTLTCTIASLAANTTSTFTLVVRTDPTLTGTLSNTADVSALGTDTAPANNSATANVTVNAPPAQADLAITKSAGPTTVPAGADVTYTMTVTNNGPASAAAPTFRDRTPLFGGANPTTFRSLTLPAGWTCSALPAVGGTGDITCAASGPMAAGRTATFVLVVRVAVATPNGTAVSNTGQTGTGATIASATADPVAGNSAATASATVGLAAAAPTCATPGADGVAEPLQGVLNTYHPGTASAAAGATSIRVGTPTGSTVPIAAGDMLLVIQMQDASINSTNTGAYGDAGAGNPARGSTNVNGSGRYEFVRATSAVAAGAVGVTALANAYTSTFDVSSIAQAAGVATVTTAVPHGLATGNVVTIVGATPAGYNGNFPITVTGANTFTYVALTSLATPATGTITGTLSSAGTTVLVLTALDRGGVGDRTTAYATSAVAHGLTTGNVVTIAGAAANRLPFNGTFAVTVTGATTFTYVMTANPGGNAGGAPTATRYEGQGERHFQVVRVPQYLRAQLGSTLTAAPWDGTSGGILALDVAAALDLGNAVVDVSGQGFRGGGGRRLTGGAGTDNDYVNLSTNDAHASKAEGIAGTPRYLWDETTNTLIDNTNEGYPSGSYARGAPGNAGGGSSDGNPPANDQNTGGGGGGNGGIGGTGGYAWYSVDPYGGFGGAAFAASAARIVLGGGGGAGTRNNSSGIHSSGGTGGGMIFIRAAEITGSGTLQADGSPGQLAENDGGGGAGSGGSIVVSTMAGDMAGLTAYARGGRGGDAWPTEAPGAYPGARHGPGGGGAGGVILTTFTPGATDVTGGANGITTTAREAYGATAGGNGIVAIGALTIPGIASGPECSADLSLAKTSAPSSPTATQATYYIVVTNHGYQTASSVTVADSLPIPPLTFGTATPSQGTCSFSSPTLTCNLGTIYGGGSAAITIVVGSSDGTAPANTATVTHSGTDPVDDNDIVTSGAEADLSVTLTGAPEPVAAGQELTYTAVVQNNGPNTATSVSVDFLVSAATTFDSILPPGGWTCTTPAVGAYGTITCTRLTAMPTLASETFRFVVLVDSGTPPNTALPATAIVTSANDTVPSNDVATTENHVLASVTLLTRTHIRGLRATPETGRVEFATGWQQQTLAFNIFGTPDAAAPGEATAPLNAEPLRAPRPTTLTPTLYHVELPPFGATHLWIEEIENGGKHNLLGPFGVADDRLAATYARLDQLARDSHAPETALGAGMTARVLPASAMRAPGRSPADALGNWTSTAGLSTYSASPETTPPSEPDGSAPTTTDDPPTRMGFAAEGTTLVAEPPTTPSLAAAAAPVVAAPQVRGLRIETAQEGEVRLSRSVLEAQGLPRGVPLANVVVTSLGLPVVAHIIARDTPSETLAFTATRLRTTYSARNVYVLTWNVAPPVMKLAGLTREGDPDWLGWYRVERSTLYVASAPRGTDPWLWDLVVSDGSTWPAYDPPMGQFELPALKPKFDPVKVRLRFTGMSAHEHDIEAAINGVSVGRVSFSGVGSALLQGTIPAAALHTGAGAAGVNDLTLHYTSSAAGGDVGLVYLDHLDVQARAATPVPPGGIPVAIAPFDARLPAMTGADYLIITHARFAAQAAQLASLKTASGHSAVVVDVQRAYDFFSTGVMDAASLRALIARARKLAPVQYVLLFGDDSFDYADYAGSGVVAYVPSLYGWDGDFGRVPSETRMADVNDDGYPEVAIGRLPAHDETEAALLVDKVARQDSVLRASASRHLMVVDVNDPTPNTPSFGRQARKIANQLGADQSIAWADAGAGIPAARTATRAGIASGVAFTHFFGHGSPWQWGNASLLTTDDVAGIAGGTPALPDGPETIALTWTCEAQMYTYLWENTVNEALILRPNGGALAAFGPAGTADAAVQAVLYERLYPELATAPTLGLAIRRAKTRALAEDPRAWRAVTGWNLLGDPALALR